MMTFQFKNFDRFRYMYNQLKQDIVVTIPVKRTGTATDYDDTGTLKQAYSDPIEMCEPIVKDTTNTLQTAGDEYESEGGGVVRISQMQWVSLRDDIPRGTKVHVVDSGHDYEVEKHTPDEVAGLTTYYLKAVLNNGNLP